MADILELELLENYDKPIEIEIDFEGEFVSGSDGQDYKRGYNEGYAKGKTDGKTEGYDEGYDEGYAKCKSEGDSYYDTFWDGWTNFGAKSPASANTFTSWTDEMFYPKYDYSPTSLQNTFANSTMNIDLSQRFKDCGVKFDTSKSLYMSGAFTNSHFTKIPFISFEKSVVSQALNAFNGCKKLVVLEGIKVLKEHKYAALFGGCSALTTIERIEGEIGSTFNVKSSPLDVATAKRILLALVNYAGTENAYANSVYFSTTTLALLEAEGNTAPDGGTWLNYIDSLGWTT